LRATCLSPFDRRAVAAIQRNVEELNERKLLSRHFHAKNDKEAIASWKADLNRILHVFAVRSIMPSLEFLMTRFQVEFAVTTHVVAIDTNHGVEKTQNKVSDLQKDVSNTKTMVSSIHRTIVERRAGVDDGNESVSIHLSSYPPLIKLNRWPESTQVCDVGCKQSHS